MHIIYGRANAFRCLDELTKDFLIPVEQTAIYPKNQGRYLLLEQKNILVRLEHNPGTNVRRISDEVGNNASLAGRILQEQLLYLYHVQEVQALNTLDCQARLVFCH